MRRLISAVLLAAAVLPPGGPAVAAAPLAITRESQRDLMVTIYNGNLGLVKDTREARLPAGMSEVQFADVAAQIDPTSVHLRPLGKSEVCLRSFARKLRRLIPETRLDQPPAPGWSGLPRA